MLQLLSLLLLATNVLHYYLWNRYLQSLEPLQRTRADSAGAPLVATFGLLAAGTLAGLITLGWRGDSAVSPAGGSSQPGVEQRGHEADGMSEAGAHADAATAGVTRSGSEFRSASESGASGASPSSGDPLREALAEPRPRIEHRHDSCVEACDSACVFPHLLLVMNKLFAIHEIPPLGSLTAIALVTGTTLVLGTRASRLGAGGRLLSGAVALAITIASVGTFVGAVLLAGVLTIVGLAPRDNKIGGGW